MAFVETTALHKIAGLTKRIRGVSGGTSASKTISILMYLIDYCQIHENELVSVVSESFPHLKRGAMRDFVNIMQDLHYYNDDLWNKTDATYVFPSGSKLEFFSADQSAKVRGPRRDVLFVNEANNINYETFTQLEIRTRKLVFIDYNPVSEFWWYTEVLANRAQDVDFLTLTYLDNEALEPSIIATIESRRANMNWWQVYGLGQLGEVEGRIYTGWKLDVDLPHEARLERRGLDFGFSIDPAALINIYYYNGGFILDEEFVRLGMKNNDIANYVENLPAPQTLIVADAAEPKSIAELRQHGISVLESSKGAGSRIQQIQYVQQQRISVTKRSLNLKKAYNNYMWKTDREGNIIANEPDHYLSDAMDAVRYGFDGLRHKKKEETPPPAAVATLIY